jgi:hypothetical protein
LRIVMGDVCMVWRFTAKINYCFDIRNSPLARAFSSCVLLLKLSALISAES